MPRSDFVSKQPDSASDGLCGDNPSEETHSIDDPGPSEEDLSSEDDPSDDDPPSDEDQLGDDPSGDDPSGEDPSGDDLSDDVLSGEEVPFDDFPCEETCEGLECEQGRVKEGVSEGGDADPVQAVEELSLAGSGEEPVGPAWSGIGEEPVEPACSGGIAGCVRWDRAEESADVGLLKGLESQRAVTQNECR